jgi:hypothetical protein
MPYPSIEGTSTSGLRPLAAAPHVKGWAPQYMRFLRPLLWLALCLPIGCTAQPITVELIYSGDSDDRCSAAEIKAQWVVELQSRLPEFRSMWEAVGPQMLRTVAALTGKSVDPRPRRVLLTLCKSPSQAVLGLSVNMRFALHSFTAEPVPLRYKVDTVFHEILHDFVSQHTPRNSALLSLHKSESQCVSLQKAVLLSLGQSEALAQVVSIDSQLPSGCYKRTWSLVNDSEDVYKQYVAELASGA